MSYTVVLQGVTMGDGTICVIGEAGISGLGVPTAKSQDVDLPGRDGAYGNPDYMGPRVILVPLNVSLADDTAAWTALDTLNAAWAPVTADVQIDFNLGTFGTVSYMGRPRGLDPNTQFVMDGVLSLIGEFHALNPVAV